MSSRPSPFLIPPRLPKGGTIAIVAPSRWPEEKWLKATTEILEAEGFHVAIHPQCFEKMGQLAGTDYARAGALMEAMTNPDVDAVMCARGGCGSNRMVDLLDFDALAESPKILIGFSDATVLLNAVMKKAGFVTYHGPMGWNFAHPHHPRTLHDMLKMLMRPVGKPLKMTYEEGVQVEREGTAFGRLVGGNLKLLDVLIGTPYEWSAKDGILFIEDVGEPLYAIDRALNHLRLAGKFKDVKAVIVGEITKMVPDESGIPYGETIQSMVMNVVPQGIPVCFNFPCGHGENLTTLPVGGEVEVVMKAGRVSLTML